jgi:hypothetical protein
MRILIDKISKPPWHVMNADDIRYLLSVAPPEWLDDLLTVRLHAAGLFAADRHAEFFRPKKQMRIFCRGVRVEIVTRDILRELASAQVNIPYAFGRAYSKPQLRLLDSIIEPHLNVALAPRKKFVAENPGRPVLGLFPPGIAVRGIRQKRIRE